jgi:hypothetical protein
VTSSSMEDDKDDASTLKREFITLDSGMHWEKHWDNVCEDAYVEKVNF